MKRIRRRGSKDAPVYAATTRNILVRVVANYLPEQSDPDQGHWFWAYVIEIENHGKEVVQLMTRHWIITDGRNRVNEIRGEGVVGEQPTLKPMEAFRYTSGCPLSTPSGTMRGFFQMVTDLGVSFDVEIPEFSLDVPGAKRVVN